ncbi:MAG: permease prefix domain 1-containing protein [Planctomycetota bacterium]
MTNREFENYLALLGRLLRLGRKQVDMISVELRDHLESRVAELVDEGIEAAEATTQALAEFGDAASLAQQFQLIDYSNRRRWAMRFATLSVAGLFLVAVLVMSLWPGDARFGAPDRSFADNNPQPRASTSSGTDKSARTRLNEQIRATLQESASMSYDEIPFVDVMRDLRNSYEINVILDQSAQDDSLAPDEPVNFEIVGVSLDTCLRVMLRNHNATYIVHDGVLRIISLDVAEDPAYFDRRILNVNSLLAKIREVEEHRIGTYRLNYGYGGSGGGGGGFGGGGGMGGGAGGGLFAIAAAPLTQEGASNAVGGVGGGDVTENQVDEGRGVGGGLDGGGGFGGGGLGGGGGYGGGFIPGSYQVTAETLLIDLIKTTVNPDSWDDTNGNGTMDIVGGLLVVFQSESTINEIESLLQDMSHELDIN